MGAGRSHLLCGLFFCRGVPVHVDKPIQMGCDLPNTALAAVAHSPVRHPLKSTRLFVVQVGAVTQNKSLALA